MLEESKSAVLAQRMNQVSGPVSHAERYVKGSEEWADYIKKMVDARTAANLARVRADFMKMRSMEWQAKEANMRAEMRL